MQNWDTIHEEWIKSNPSTLIDYLKENKICFTIDDIIKAVEYGFKYSTESMNDGTVPIRNILQWIMYQKQLSKIPTEFQPYLNKSEHK